MTQKNMNSAKQNTKKIVSDFKKSANIVVADVKINIRKARADIINAVDHDMADEKAEVAKRNADAMPNGLRQKAEYLRADWNAGIDKVKANRRHNLAYAKADSERAKTIDERESA